jgi:hypothetical protein
LAGAANHIIAAIFACNAVAAGIAGEDSVIARASSDCIVAARSNTSRRAAIEQNARLCWMPPLYRKIAITSTVLLWINCATAKVV